MAKEIEVKTYVTKGGHIIRCARNKRIEAAVEVIRKGEKPCQPTS